MNEFESAIQYFDKLPESLSKVTYFIGVDKAKTEGSYCLVMRVKDNTSLLLVKTIRNRKKFDEEVKHLVEIFDATILEEN